ncbi:hypothetical protein ACRBEV_01845 [Methylobacterium phyllosphaerae]
MANRVVRDHPSDLFVIEVDAELTGLSSFWTWCVAVRNRLDYLRRQDQSWRGVGLMVWLCTDDRVRGIVGLGGNSPERFIDAFNRWLVSLRPISVTVLRTEIATIARPEMVTGCMPLNGRYQRLKLTIRRHQRPGSIHLGRLRARRQHDHAPMPVVL